MKIALDADEVLGKFVQGVIPTLNRRFGKQIAFDEVRDFYLERVWDVGAGEMRQAITEHFAGSGISDMEPYEGARETLEELVRAGHQNYLVTSRPKEFHQQTCDWAKRHFPGLISECYSTDGFSMDGLTSAHKKAEICSANKIRILVDDCVDNIHAAQGNGVYSILFRRPWNTLERLAPQVLCAETWPNVKRAVEGICIHYGKYE